MGALIDVRDTPLSVDDALQAVRHDSAGGVVLFVGMVRDQNDGKPVSSLEYEAYGAMAKAEMQRIADEIVAGHAEVRIAAIHRIGALKVGEIAVVCAASAPHRQLAFEACRLLIDNIKERVPVWKREHGPDGSTWVGWEGPSRP